MPRGTIGRSKTCETIPSENQFPFSCIFLTRALEGAAAGDQLIVVIDPTFEFYFYLLSTQ